MTYRLHPAALDDLQESVGFYSERGGPVLARTFLDRFEDTANKIISNPAIGTPRYHNKRRFINDEIRIYAVAHQSRKPGFWKGRRFRGSN
jgi:plasmid stabilization system protein ParE